MIWKFYLINIKGKKSSSAIFSPVMILSLEKSHKINGIRINKYKMKKVKHKHRRISSTQNSQ